MPIFDLNGKKYDVEDKYLDAFSKQNPDAYTIEEREGKRYKVRAKDYGNFRTHFDKPQQEAVQQPEDDAVFDANAERFRNGQPTERVTTQSMIDAHPELGLQTNAVQPESPKWNVPQYDWRTDKQKKLDELSSSTTATPVQDQYGNEYYPVKPREVAYDEAVRGLKDISERKAETKSRLQAISNDVSNELNRLQGQVDVSDLDKFRPANLQSMPVNPVNQELMSEYTALRKAQRLVEESNNIIEEASKKGNTNFMAGLARGFWDNLNAEDYTFGADDAAQSAFLYRALDKAEKGEALTKAEETLLDAAAINMAVQSYYAQDLGKGYGAGQVTAENLPFMLEMAINPISASGKTTAKALLKYGLKKFAKNKAAKVGARLAGDALAATGMAATTGFGDVLEGTTDRLAQNYNYRLDDEGRLHVEKKDDTMGMGEAFARSFATRAIENQSEMIFKAFEPIGGFMKGVQDVLPGGVNKFFDMLSHNKAADAYRWLKNSKVFRNYLVKDFRNATQIGGYVEERMEELYNDLANFAIGEMSFEELTDLDRNIDTSLGLLPTQIMFGLLGLGGAGAMRYQTRRTLEDLQATMNEQQRKELEGLLDMGLDAKEVDVRGFIRNVMQNEGYTIENKRDLIKAAFAVAKQNGIDELTEADTIDKVNAENALIDSVTDPSTGVYAEMTATLPNGEGGNAPVQGYVVGWMGKDEKRQPIFLPEGLENTYENRRVLKPEQWSEEAVQQMPAEEVKALNEEMIREEEAVKAENEARWNPNVPEPQEGVSFFNGEEEVTIVGIDANTGGLFVAPSEEYRSAQGNEKKMAELVNGAFQLGAIPVEQYKDAMTQQIEAEEKASKVGDVKIENEQQVVRNGETYTVISVDADGIQYKKNNGETNKVPVDVWKSWVYDQKQTEAPTNVVSGEPAGEQVNAGVKTQVNNPNVQPVAEGVATQPKAEVKPQTPVIPTKEDGSVDFVSYGKEGTFKALGEKYGEKMPNKVAVTAKALADDLAKAQKKLDKAIEDYDNAPIGREDKAEKARDKAQQELDAIKREADFWAEMDTEIKDAQFRRASMLNPQAETETSSEPMNADEFVAQQLAAGNIVLNKEDYKRETGYGDAEANAMNGGAAKMFGENGMTIQEAGERLMEMDRENGTNFFDQSDSNAGRDALISLLGSVKSRKELNQYIASNRAEQAKKESEGLRNELERSVMDANYASLEDYVLQMEADEMENPFSDVNADEILAIFAEAVEEYNNYLNPQENGQGTTEESIEGNGELLSEEQSSDTGGTEVRQESARNGEGAAEESETADAATEVELKQQEGETPLQFAERAAKENERRAPLRKRVKEWEKLLGVKVNVIENPGGVRNKEALRYIAKGKNPSGWVESNGEVAIYLPGVSNVDEVDKTIIHEVVAHKGLPGLLGKERFDELCDKVWAMMSEAKRAEYYDYVGDRFGSKEERQRAAADEYMAFLSEEVGLSLEEKTIWDNIVKMFRELLDKALNGIISKSKLTDADIAELIKASYANLKSGAEGGAVGEGTRFSAKKKRALETVSTSRKKHQQTVISSADGAKILNNLDNLAEKYENDTHTKEKTFIGEVAKAIEARKQGSGSQYATFETVNGNVVTIRLADHNATVSNFDNRDENEGISIVVSAKDNNGITNDGDAHIVEYFYDSIDLRRADGKPLAEIVKSIKQSLYSGEYKDTTGLAERQEVNESRFRVVTDKNGKKTLVGLHNISEAKLKKAIKQGGLANPSVAVIDMDKQSHVDYGDITLVLPESMIDKKSGKNIGTYMADAYTPIYPTVVKQMTDKGYKVFNKALDDVNEFFRSKVRSYFNSYLDTGTIYDALYYWYLSDTGKNPPTLEAALPSDFTREEVDKVKSINPEADSFFQLSEEDKQKALVLYAEKFYNGIEAYKEYLADYIRRMQEVVKDESKPAMVRNRIQKNLSEIENYGFEYDYVAAYYNRGMLLASRQSKPGDVETFSNARNEVVKKGLNDEFNQWLANKESDLGVEEKLFKGYDNQGRAKYVPNTLENASKLMKKEGRAGATGYGGFNEFVAILAPVAKTTKELNKKKQNLSTKEAYDEFVEQWSGHYHDLAQKLQPGADKWADYGYHRLQEIAPMANPRDYVKREYGIELSEEFMKDLNDIKTAIKNDFPARYFETKFERPVYLNEFVAAVVPSDMGLDLYGQLQRMGIPMYEYERGNNEARMAAVDKVAIDNEGVRFRISEKGKQIQAEVDKFTEKYNSKPVVLVDSEMTDEELEEAVPESSANRTREEISSGYPGGYSRDTDKIYIFVDNQELGDLGTTMFHENLHPMYNGSSMVEELYNNAKEDKKALIEALSEAYEESEIPNEMFAHMIAKDIVRGDFKFAEKYLSEESRNELFNTLKEFGYDRVEEESIRRRQGNLRSDITLDKEPQTSEQVDGGLQEGKAVSPRERKERLGKLFDQVADMGLEGVLENKAYTSMMVDIYKALPEAVRTEIADDAIRLYGGSVAPAVSDYIGVKSKESIIDKIVTIVREALRKVGFDLDLNANEVRYLAWRSKKPLDRNNLLEVAEDIDMKNRLKVGEYDGTTPDGGGTRFRAKKADPIDVSDERPQIIKDYDNELQTKSFNFQEAFQDRMLSVKVLMDKIVEATGKKVRSFEDVYKAENELGSTNRPAQLKYIEEFFNPLVKKVQELSDEYGHEAVRRYIYCKSGLERNEVLRQRDADEAYNEAKEELDGKLASGSITQAQYNALLKLADDQRKDTLSKDIDYSGIRGLLFNSRVAEVEKDYQDGKIDKQTRDVRINGLKSSKGQIMSGWKKFAEDQVFYLEQKAGQKKLDELWDKINAATNETLRIDFESGMIDRDTYNAEKNMMKYYVPLRNWKDTVAEDMYEYRHDMTPAVSSNQKRAEGRKSEAENPIATIGLMAQNAIVRGNRNKMKMKLYAFVSNRETPLASIRNVWYEKDATGTWIPKYADTSKAKSEAEMKQILDQFEQNMEALAEQGKAFKGKAKFGMGFRANRSQKDEHVVTVMINGKEYGIYINGNPRAAQAVNGMTNAEGIDDGYAWVDKLKRLYGGGLTSWNPDFIIPNLVRDTIHASTMTFLDRGVLGSLQYMANIPKIFAQVSAEVSGLSTGNPKLHQYFEEFVANGGETGYTEIHTLEDYKKEYKKLINEAKGLKPSLKNGFEKIAKILEAANRIAEDVNRFNAYVTSREAGENIVNSVDAAKNITVNFNRKGALHANSSVFGKVASFMSRWILFFNPSVQGIHQIVTKSKLNPKRATALGATIIASGFLMPMLNEMLVAAFGDGDDDDYWNQSDYKRRNNWMLFTGDGYVSIPLPPVLREIYGMGDIIYGVMTGHIPPQRAIYDVLNQVQSAIGFVTLLPEVSQEPDVKTWLKGFAPDLASPFLDVMSNTNFMGRPIAKWTDYNETDPEYERVYKGVGKHWVEVSKFLNEVRGNETRRSDWWGNMINPAMMEHLVTSYAGGIGKTINNLVGMAIDAVEGDTENMDVFRKTPIIPRFYTPNDEKTVYPGINRKFYEFEYQYNNAKKSLKKANEGVASGKHPEWQKYINEMDKNGEKKFIEYFKEEQKKLKKLQNELKEDPNNKELEKQVYDKKAEIATESFKILSGQK